MNCGLLCRPDTRVGTVCRYMLLSTVAHTSFIHRFLLCLLLSPRSVCERSDDPEAADGFMVLTTHCCFPKMAPSSRGVKLLYTLVGPLLCAVPHLCGTRLFCRATRSEFCFFFFERQCSLNAESVSAQAAGASSWTFSTTL